MSLEWWQLFLLLYAARCLGFMEGVVLERERYLTWMANSWELLNRRLWWVTIVKPAETMEEMAELSGNMLKTIDDYNQVFGREYKKEALLPNESISPTTKETQSNDHLE